VLATLVGAVAGWLAAGAIPATYQSTARVLVGPVNADFDTIRASSELTQTYADLATGDQVLDNAIRAAGLALTPPDLAAAVKSTPNAQARTVAIAVELPSADESVRAANAIADSLTAFTASGTDRPEGTLSVVDRATPAEAPVAPRTALIVLLAAAGALLGALLIVSAIEYLDPTIRDADHLGRVAGPALLAVVPVLRRREFAGRGSPNPTASDPSYRTLLGDLIARARGPVRAVLVTSTSDGGNAAQVAAGLASAATQVGARVALVDAADEDANASGAAEGPVGVEPADTVRIVRNRPVRGPQEAAGIRDGLLRDDELVIVDAGSVQGSFAAPIWAQAVDSVVVVSGFGLGRRDVLDDALEGFTTADADVWVVGAKPISLRRARGTTGRRDEEHEDQPRDGRRAERAAPHASALTTDAVDLDGGGSASVAAVLPQGRPFAGPRDGGSPRGPGGRRGADDVGRP